MIDREEYEKLTPEEQETLFRQSTFAEKSDLLIRSHDPAKLVRSMSQEELYLVTREMDIEERSEAIQNATLPQMQFIADMDCWKGDRADGRGFSLWLETLLASGTEKALTWLLNVNYETLVAGFLGVMEVLKPEWEYASDELLGDRPFFTIDGQYHIYVPEECLHTMKRVMELLFENHRGRYVAILEGLLAENRDLLEEEAYRLREIRLSERGFPDIETARRVYKGITPEEFDAFPKKENSGRTSETGPLPNYLALVSDKELFLDQVLVLFKADVPGVLEGIEEELAWLSNKVIAAEGFDFSSEAEVWRGVSRARKYVSIGLEILSGGEIDKAAVYLRERWLETIFRTAASRIWRVRARASSVARQYWHSHQELMLETLDGIYGFIFRGLFEQVPQCYDEAIAENTYHLRDFKSLAEVDRSERAVEQVQSLATWLAPTWDKKFIGALDEVRVYSESGGFFSILGTVFARSVLRLKQAALPLTEAQVVKFFDDSFTHQAAWARLKPALKKEFQEKHFSKQDQVLLLPIWGLVFDAIENASEGATKKDAAAKLRSALWIKSEAKKNSRRRT